MNDTRDREFLSVLDDISRSIGENKKVEDIVSVGDIDTFIREASGVGEIFADKKNADRLLRIGVVGEIKTGKSTFLNSLVFDAESVLPEAPTPMTAALTKLSYSDKRRAKVFFYSEKDYGDIESQAEDFDAFLREKLEEERKRHSGKTKSLALTNAPYEKSAPYKEPDMETIKDMYGDERKEKKACRELIDMVNKAGLDPRGHLGKEVEIPWEQLNDYVGSKGKYTPIVKYTEIYIDNPILKDLEIIDTPGLHDPVISRSNLTKDFLAKCDAVFLLSYTGQFLSSEDILFLRDTLPSEGVKKAILIGSKFDSVVLDYKEKNASIKDALLKTKRSLDTQASDNLRKFTERPNCPATIIEIEKNLPPTYVSSILFSAAKKMERNRPLSEGESHIIAQMTKRFDGFRSDPQFLVEFSRIYDIKNKQLEEVRSEKNAIMEASVNDLTNSFAAKFINRLESMNISANEKLDNMRKYDMDELQKQLNVSIEAINSVRRDIKNIFEDNAINARKVLKKIEADIEREVNNFTSIEVNTDTQRHRHVERGGFLWLRKDVYYTTTTTKTASVSDVVRNIRQFVAEVKMFASSEFDSLFNMNELRRKITQSFDAAINATGRQFNADSVIQSVRTLLNSLTVPDVALNAEKYDDDISKHFHSNTVEGDGIADLKRYQESAMLHVLKDVADEFDRTGNKIAGELTEKAGSFVDDIEKELSGSVKQTKKLLENKEASVKLCEDFVEKIAKYKDALRVFRG